MNNHEHILFVDLSNRNYWIEQLDQEILDLYLGGRGLGARLLAQYLPVNQDPLESNNPLIFSVGPLQGILSPFSSKAVLSTKSPLTEIYLFSIASGMFGHYLAQSGFKALVIIGTSEMPVYVWINDGIVEFHDAQALWNKPITEAYHHLVAEINAHNIGVAMIGPAGEQLVRYASVITELPRKRSFGRGGAGAVMGAKKLKAVAIFSSGKIQIANNGLFQRTIREMVRQVKVNDDWRSRRKNYGTTTSMPNLQMNGMLPTRNWQRGSFGGYKNISPSAFGNRWAKQTNPCAPGCPAPCAISYKVDDGDYAGVASEGPDYETIYAFGSNCAIDRFDAIIAIDNLCDELGLDTISAGVTTSFVMECFERGLLKEDSTAGLNITFGDHNAAVEVVKMIASRTGFGDVMAEGVKRCAAIIGKGSEKFAMHSKGLELGGWGCQAAYGQALQYALSSRGGCHHDLGLPGKIECGNPFATDVEGKGKLVFECATKRIFRDSLIQCAFAELYINIESVMELLGAITGKQFTINDLYQTSERIINLERIINVREGVNRSSDRLPERLIMEPLLDGPKRGSTVPLEKLKDDFYSFMGWDNVTGVPTYETLLRIKMDPEVLKIFHPYTV